MIKKFKKKPVVVEAIRLNKDNEMDVLSFIGFNTLTQTFDSGVIIPTLEGNMLANYGDWIIKGIKGEFYHCKHEIFIETYESCD